MRYTLKPSTENVFFITSGRVKWGQVVRAKDGQWVATMVMGTLIERADTAANAFHALMRARNRIQLCGENNEEKARAVLAERNARVRAEVKALNDAAGYKVARVRNRKIRI